MGQNVNGITVERRTPDYFVIHQSSSGYHLELLPLRVPPFVSVCFRSPDGKVVTDRDLNMYRHPDLINFKPDPSLQYIEIGAGLGELTTAIAASNPEKLPIIIDPADYITMGIILEGTLTKDLTPLMRHRLKKVLDRQNLVISNKVQLINMTLEEAMVRHPEIRGTGDVVIDYHGPVNHENTPLSYIEILNLERQLRTPLGKHIFWGTAIEGA
ncbi:hypothetical protein J4227_03240 [Candidatus Woesearchaeota archaeon]|nr:hypothetical protein [Candidatus Woesearchaeota archaeon]